MLLSNRIPGFLLTFFSLLLLHFMFSSFEVYEIYFNDFVNGLTTEHAIGDYDIDMHFLTLSVLSFLGKHTSTLNIYAVYLITLNSLSFILLFDLLKNNFPIGSKKNTILFFIILTPIVIDNILNLSTTRIAFICIAVVFIQLFKKEKISVHDLIKYSIVIIFLALTRIDAILLSSIIFFLVGIINKNKHYKFILPFFISFIVFISYNTMLSKSDRTDKKVFYYQELDFFDRNNFDFKMLNPKEKKLIEILLGHQIMDESHFDYKRNSEILKTNKNPFVNSIFDVKLFVKTLVNSKEEILKSKIFIVFAMFFLIIHIKQLIQLEKKKVFSAILFLFFPIFVSLYVQLPARFLIPYYFIYILITSLFLIKKSYNIYWYMFFIISLIGGYFQLSVLKAEHGSFSENIEKIKTIENDLIVVDNINQGFFLPKKVRLIEKNEKSFMFLNYYYFNSYEAYKTKWSKLCHCNSLSLAEKVEFVSKNKIPVVMKKEMPSVYEDIFKQLWDLKFRSQKIGEFNQQMDIFLLEI